MPTQTLYIFNPDHDLALANGDTNFMAPAAARRLAADLAVIPAWYADEGSLVLAPSAYNAPFLKQCREAFPSLPATVTEAEIHGKDLRVAPWGWNHSLSKNLLRAGIEPSRLCTEDELATIRKYAHRRFSGALLSRLRESADGTCGESFFFEKEEDIRRFVENRERCVLKAPLSGSGKGLTWCKGVYTYHIEHWCARVLALQGGVIGEPACDKQTDFSMQFFCGPDVKFRGYSLFRTNPAGAYTGSILTSDEEVERLIGKHIPPALTEQVKRELEQSLTAHLSGKYTGYLSVDMMVCRCPDEPHYRLHPCVEVNLRMTMGMLSHTLFERYISPSSQGMFRIEYYPSTGQLQDVHRQLAGQHTVSVSGGRVSEGYLPLVPITPHSRYMAWLVVEPCSEIS